MVKINNKEEFNNTKHEKEITIERNRNFKGELVVEDYSELEKLYLQDVKKVDKIVLKNSVKLQECTIWNCDTSDLIIENCPQIKKLTVRQNNLTSLEFLKGLENLEELEIDGNTKINSGLEYLPGSWENFSYEHTKLTDILKLYGNNWKTCKKDAQQILELSTKQDFQGLIKKFWDLKKSREKLKKEVSSFTNHGTTSKPIKTIELVSNLEKEFKEKEERINGLEKKLNNLEVDLVKERKGQLEKLKSEFIEEKLKVYNIIGREKKKEKIRKNLENYLISIESLLINSDDLPSLALKKVSREYLIKGKSRLAELLDELGEKHREISSKKIQKKEITNELQREIEGIKKLIPLEEESELDSKLLKELKDKIGFFQTKVVTKETKNYLEAKKNYLDLRLEIAKGLQKCCNELSKHSNIDNSKKKAIIEGISKILSVVTVTVPAKVVNVSVNFSKLAEAFSTIIDYRSVIFTEEHEKEFQKYLENSKDIISSFTESYDLLKKALEEDRNLPISLKIIKDFDLEDTEGSTKPLKTFKTRYEVIRDVAEELEERHFKFEEMKEKVKSIVKILNDLNTELSVEKNRFDDIKKLEQQTQIQISPK